MESRRNHALQRHDYGGCSREFLLVNLKWGDNHMRLLRIGAMDGLAVMPKSGLCESFRVSAGLSAFRPSVAVGMERDALDDKQFAATVKLGGPGVVRGRRNLREKWAGRRQLLKNRRHVFADGKLRLLAGFHPKIGEA